jgi:tRNA dimethylallyltransferase
VKKKQSLFRHPVYAWTCSSNALPGCSFVVKDYESACEHATEDKPLQRKAQKVKLVVIAGPTGLGKTAAAIRLAEHFGAQIIGADSMQIYRHMDIGTAKPTPEERARVVHHLVDIVDPDQSFDAARYGKMGREIVDSLHRRGVLALVVGGTGLYIKALVHGLFHLPPTDPETRRRLKDLAQSIGSHAMHRKLAECDPEAAARIHPNDTFRIVRALEVFAVAGKPLSMLHRQHRFAETPYDVLKIALNMEREPLYHRIDARVEAMVAQGLLDEVHNLLARGYTGELKPMQSLGYRQMLDYIQGHLTWPEAVCQIKRDTRRYAKRQMTWLRADPGFVWIAPDSKDRLIGLVTDFLKAGSAVRL